MTMTIRPVRIGFERVLRLIQDFLRRKATRAMCRKNLDHRSNLEHRRRKKKNGDENTKHEDPRRTERDEENETRTQTPLPSSYQANEYQKGSQTNLREKQEHKEAHSLLPPNHLSHIQDLALYLADDVFGAEEAY